MRNLFALPLVVVLAGPATAQEFPSRPITLIAPFAAGGSTDLVGRVLSEGLKARLGQPVTIDNKAGGTGAIGTREMVKSTPDGHTLLIGSLGSQVLPPAMVPNFPIDPLRDLVPVAAAAEWVGVMLAKKDLPVASLPEFIAYARARPGTLNFGTSGHGSVVHLIAEVLMKQAGITMQHVPYRGGAQSMTDLLSGSLDVLFTSSPVAVGQAENRNLKMLAVAGKSRLANLPNVPTMQEGGIPGALPTSWLGVFGPPGLPEPIRQKLGAALVEIARDPDSQAKLRAIGIEPLDMDVAAFEAFFRAEVQRWGDFVRQNGLVQKP